MIKSECIPIMVRSNVDIMPHFDIYASLFILVLRSPLPSPTHPFWDAHYASVTVSDHPESQHYTIIRPTGYLTICVFFCIANISVTEFSKASARA